ncbi:MAG TPA: NAD(P)H-dependent glycerol-3-phosphate dehydrogenase [Gemmatimonadales bacterium]|jgi:glycerol-3-phosphate dehydrogenase (NAD(P)+)|nr:NAD(P)H-dependent glycerol-3-phosphate dehydrogenase [Gemmatimonadales bacterium]
MTIVAVLGAGSWGTTLADLLARQGHEVRLWAYEAEVVEAINRGHVNELFLPEAPLAPSLLAHADAREAAAGASVVVSAAPSHAVRAVLAAVAQWLRPRTLVVSATKGLECDTLLFMSQVAAQVVPTARFVALSGPSFALEVYRRQPTAVVAASTEQAAAREAQELFSSGSFRVYSNADVLGTEIGGALKNVVAIAAGVLEGLGMGHNPRAALLTRGLAEMARLGTALGAEARTFAGLAGMGDLILTATGGLSRNRALGVALARGERLAEYTAGHRTVAEGVNTARAAVRLAGQAGVELPITAQVAQLLFAGKSPRDAILDLMERTLKPEQWT